MRCFIAIDIDPVLRQRIVEIQSKFGNGKLKFVEPENLHFTLRFLGEITEEQARQIRHALKTIEYPKFDIELYKIDGFPSLEKARTIWVGIRHEQFVNKLVNLIGQKLEEAGFEKAEKSGKEFNCHLTIARTKQKPVGLTSIKDMLENIQI